MKFKISISIKLKKKIIKTIQKSTWQSFGYDEYNLKLSEAK